MNGNTYRKEDIFCFRSFLLSPLKSKHTASILNWVGAFFISLSLSKYNYCDAGRVMLLHTVLYFLFGSFYIFSSGLIVSSRNRKGDCQLINNVIKFLRCRRLTTGAWIENFSYVPYRMG